MGAVLAEFRRRAAFLRRQLRRPVVGWPAGLAAFAAAVFLFFLAVPGWIVTDDEVADAGERESLQNDVRTTGMQLLAGVVLGFGAVFTARTLALNREGQITERFSRAVDQLGHEDLSVQLGGIYALERIARDSARDHGPIMEILTAYVRVHSPWPAQHQLPGGLRAEIRAVMTVLGRRNLANERDRAQPPLDLSWTDLREGDWTFGCLERVLFRGTHLEGAELAGAHLEGADLAGAHLDGVSFDDETTWPAGFAPPLSGRSD
jgi:hypothetical protein